MVKTILLPFWEGLGRGKGDFKKSEFLLFQLVSVATGLQEESWFVLFILSISLLDTAVRSPFAFSVSAHTSWSPAP